MAEPIDADARRLLRARRRAAPARPLPPAPPRAPHRAVRVSRDTAAAPAVLVSAAAVPFRPHRGIYVVVEERATAARPTLAPSTSRRCSRCRVSPASGRSRRPASSTSRRWTAGARRITVCWLDDEPLEVAGRLAPLVARVVTRRGVARDLRRTVRDDHAVEVGLVRRVAIAARRSRGRIVARAAPSPTRSRSVSASGT